MSPRSDAKLAGAFEVLVTSARSVALTDQVRVSRADLEGYLADLGRSAPRW